MPTRSGRATFNFKAVVQATGVKADTLRAWERRYGLPCPQRTPGGHRLFAQRDIDTVHWLKARLLEGMTISRAAALWHNLEAEGHDPLIALPAVPAGGPQAFPVLHGPALEHAREVWLEACLRFQEAQAEAAIAHALAQYPAEVVAVEVLSRGLAEIGERWYRADVSVHQEHFTSALAARRLEALITALPQPSLPGTLLVGAAPDDLHGFAPLLLTYLLRRRGRRATFMGVDIPLGRFEQTLQQAQPDFVILSAQRLPAAANLSAFGQLLAGRSIPFAFAGGVFDRHPGLRARIRGRFLGSDFPQALEAAEAILAASPPTPEPVPESRSHRKALRAYLDSLPAIEPELQARLVAAGFPEPFLRQALSFLEENLRAGLELGTLDAVPAEIEWVHGLLGARGMGTEFLFQILTIYHEILENAMGPTGQPIVRALVASLEALNKSDGFAGQEGNET